MKIMPFDSVHHALAWYFNPSWKRAGHYDRTNWPDGERVQSSPKMVGVEAVADAFLKVRDVLEAILTARDVSILSEHYRHRGATQAEMAMQYDVTDRGIRDIRDRAVEKIDAEFIRVGIVRPPKVEEPVHAKVGGENIRDVG